MTGIRIGSGPNPGLKDDRQALKVACEEFSAIFWGQVFAGLRQTVPEGGLFPESAGERIFKSMLDTEYARVIARSEGSLAQIMFQQLARSNREG
ncbi:MAG: hypothetical protein GX952_00165 [Firmicutes bacterium]|mgnify:CR=1 FL=1|nr:hypothetical protein [Bacillota bacterium]